MTAYLLDTSTAIKALSRPEILPAHVHETVLRGPNVLSVICYWEVLLKSMKGNLDVGDPRVWWNDAIDQLAATILPLRPNHIAAIYDLRPIHQDPFDRALIAQATVEGLTLVTTDTTIPKYASEHLHVLA